jgi:hypothetical protein
MPFVARWTKTAQDSYHGDERAYGILAFRWEWQSCTESIIGIRAFFRVKEQLSV